MLLPRISRRSSGDMALMSMPSNMTPPSTWALAGRYPIMAKATVDLPQPDSPTKPSTSPRAISSSTPRTARTAPRPVWKVTARSSIRISGASAFGVCVVMVY